MTNNTHNPFKRIVKDLITRISLSLLFLSLFLGIIYAVLQSLFIMTTVGSIMGGYSPYDTLFYITLSIFVVGILLGLIGGVNYH